MTRFVVHRRPFCTDQDGRDTGSRVPLAVFRTRAAAEGHAAGLLREAVRALSPFTSFDDIWPDPAPEQLLALGVRFAHWPPPVYGSGNWPDWSAWYDAEFPHLSDDERARVWATFVPEPLFEVAELDVSEE